MIIISAVAAGLFSGCATFAEIAIETAIENRNNSQIKAGLQCNTMQISCVAPNYYSEWHTPAGDLKCQCEP